MLHYKNDFNHNNSKTTLKYKLSKNSRKLNIFQSLGQNPQINITSISFQYHGNSCFVLNDPSYRGILENVFFFFDDFIVSLIEFNPLSATK